MGNTINNMINHDPNREFNRYLEQLTFDQIRSLLNKKHHQTKIIIPSLLNICLKVITSNYEIEEIDEIEKIDDLVNINVDMKCNNCNAYCYLSEYCNFHHTCLKCCYKNEILILKDQYPNHSLHCCLTIYNKYYKNPIRMHYEMEHRALIGAVSDPGPIGPWYDSIFY